MDAEEWLVRFSCVSRKMAFIGYRDEGSAQEAVRYFNKTFVGATRLGVEIARPVGDPLSLLERKWSVWSLLGW